ncbi:MAG: alpha/beta hydrolase [Pseudomonadota bacterium]
MQRDWDDAFANMAHIPGGEALAAAWPEDAAQFRSKHRGKLDIRYGEGDRQSLDLFYPNEQPKGIMIFVHGGYWMRFGREDFSHLAQGAVDAGYIACLPSYPRAPDVRIAKITQEIARAVQSVAHMIAGPLYLCGHSAGAHLALRMVCDDSHLPEPVLARIGRVTGIGGVYDLRPLMMTSMNSTLHLDESEAASESPVLRQPKLCCPLTIWVGAKERPEFVRQSRLLAMMWDGLGADLTIVEDAGRNHFDVIDGLRDVDSPLMRAVLG